MEVREAISFMEHNILVKKSLLFLPQLLSNFGLRKAVHLLSGNRASAASLSISPGDCCTCGGHQAAHSPPSNDTVQGHRLREAIRQAVTELATFPLISLMFFISITYKPGSSIHIREGLSWRCLPQRRVWVRHKNLYVYSLIYRSEKQVNSVSPFSLCCFPHKFVPLGHPARHETQGCERFVHHGPNFK